MSELPNAPDVGGSDAVTVTPAANTPATMNVTEAARALQSARYKKPEAESAEPAEQPEPVSAQADDAQPERLIPSKRPTRPNRLQSRPSSPRGLGRRKRKNDGNPCLAKRRNILRNANRSVIGKSAVVKTRPLKSSKA
jgi:hypothetical protein